MSQKRFSLPSTANPQDHEKTGLRAGLLTPLLSGAHSSSDDAVLEAALNVEVTLTEVLAEQQLATAEQLAAVREAAKLEHFSVVELAQAARRGGNFIIPLVEQLKQRAESQLEGSSWAVHPGATSQDILDSALMLVAHDTAMQLVDQLSAIEGRLVALAGEHADSLCVARTLTQHSIPYSWGLRFAQWLTAVHGAKHQLQQWAASAPLQWGGASGTNAALNARFGSELATTIGQQTAEKLSLKYPDLPWHSNRQPVIDLAHALAAVNTALGTIANTVALHSRPEFAELAETIGEGQGGSSAMPQKRNPIRSILIRTAVSPVPSLVADLIRLGVTVDERTGGEWQAEWPLLQQLLTITEAVSGETDALLAGLRVDVELAAERVLAEPSLLSERVMQELGPVLGAAKVKAILAEAGAAEDLAARLLQEAPQRFANLAEAQKFVDPRQYLGQAHEMIERALQQIDDD